MPWFKNGQGMSFLSLGALRKPQNTWGTPAAPAAPAQTISPFRQTDRHAGPRAAAESWQPLHCHTVPSAGTSTAERV